MIFTQEDIERFISPEVELAGEVEEILTDLAPIFKEALQEASPFETDINVSSLPRDARETFIEVLQDVEMEKVVTPVLWNNGILMQVYTHSQDIVSLSVTINVPRLKELLIPTV